MLKLEDFFARGWRPFTHLALLQGAVLVAVRMFVGAENLVLAQVGGFLYLVLVCADAVVCFGRERWRVALVARLRLVFARMGVTDR